MFTLDFKAFANIIDSVFSNTMYIGWCSTPDYQIQIQLYRPSSQLRGAFKK